MFDVHPALLRVWKRLPAPVRRAVHLSRMAFSNLVRPAKVGLRWRRGAPSREPVIVVGLFSVATGIGASARLFAAALESAGVRVVRHDAAAALRHPTDLPVPKDSLPPGGMVVSHLNPPELERWLSRDGARIIAGRRHVGYWSWELPAAPPAWRSAVRYVDAVLCQSNFTAAAIRDLAPDLVVTVLPHPVASTIQQPIPASLPEPAARRRFLVKADFNSSAARKNPAGAVMAWLRAFPEPCPERATLVCKLRHFDHDADAMIQIRTLAEGRPDIEIVTAALSHAEMTQLMDSVDGVISLHRAEGFGLGPAEALWRGKAVVATGWSGSEDFLDDAWAERVAWSLTPVDDPQGLYAGGVWAEPDLDDAARRLVRLVDDPEWLADRKTRARAAALTLFDPDAWGARAKRALHLIHVAAHTVNPYESTKQRGEEP